MENAANPTTQIVSIHFLLNKRKKQRLNRVENNVLQNALLSFLDIIIANLFLPYCTIVKWDRSIAKQRIHARTRKVRNLPGETGSQKTIHSKRSAYQRQTYNRVLG